MKNFKIIIFIFSFCGISLISCTKDEITLQYAYIHNTTNHDIKILFYKNGIVNLDDTVKIKPKEIILFADSWEFGDYNSPGFSSEHAVHQDDSAIVIFDNIYYVSHYYKTPSNLSDKHHLNESVRNLSNPNNYEFEKIRSKKERVNNHRYYFTEADYEFAKD